MPRIIPLRSYSKVDAPFEESGFVIARGAIVLDRLAAFHRDLAWLAHCIFGEAGQLDENDPAQFVSFLSDMERDKSDAFREYLNSVAQLRSYEAVCFCDGLQDRIAKIADQIGSVLLAARGGLFFNKPGGTRLQYKWHQEWSYFPDHDTGLHVWFPVFQGIPKTGGAMLVAAGTHHERFDFVQSRAPGSYLQNETQFDVDRYDIVSCDLELGDAVIFHHNLAHCTDTSITGVPRVTGIARFVGRVDRKFADLRKT